MPRLKNHINEIREIRDQTGGFTKEIKLEEGHSQKKKSWNTGIDLTCTSDSGIFLLRRGGEG